MEGKGTGNTTDTFIPDLDTEGGPTLTVENGGAKPAIEVDSRGFIGRDLFAKATQKPPRTKVVTFPEHTAWSGAKMRIKEIRAGEKSKVNASVVKGKAGDNTIDTSEQDARMIIAAAINEDGKQTFNEKNDLAMVMAMPASCSEFLVDEIQKLYQKPKDEQGNELGKLYWNGFEQLICLVAKDWMHVPPSVVDDLPVEEVERMGNFLRLEALNEVWRHEEHQDLYIGVAQKKRRDRGQKCERVEDEEMNIELEAKLLCLKDATDRKPGQQRRERTAGGPPESVKKASFGGR